MTCIQPSLPINPPVVVNWLTIRIAAALGVERYGLSFGRFWFQDFFTFDAVHHEFRIVIRMREVLHGPVHARGKFILISLPPTPDRRLIGNVLLPVRSFHCIL